MLHDPPQQPRGPASSLPQYPCNDRTEGSIHQWSISLPAHHCLAQVLVPLQAIDAKDCAHLQAACKMQALKLKVIEQRLLSFTYTDQTVPALRAVSQHLEAAEQEAVETYQQASLSGLLQCAPLPDGDDAGCMNSLVPLRSWRRGSNSMRSWGPILSLSRRGTSSCWRT